METCVLQTVETKKRASEYAALWDTWAGFHLLGRFSELITNSLAASRDWMLSV